MNTASTVEKLISNAHANRLFTNVGSPEEAQSRYALFSKTWPASAGILGIARDAAIRQLRQKTWEMGRAATIAAVEQNRQGGDADLASMIRASGASTAQQIAEVVAINVRVSDDQDADTDSIVTIRPETADRVPVFTPSKPATLVEEAVPEPRQTLVIATKPIKAITAAPTVANATPPAQTVIVTTAPQRDEMVAGGDVFEAHTGRGSKHIKYYPAQWAYLDSTTRLEVAETFYNDCGGAGALWQAVERGWMKAEHAGELITIVQQRRSDRGRKAAETKQKNFAAQV